MPKIKTVRGIENRNVVSQKEWLVARKKFLLKDGKRYGHILDPRTGSPVEDAPRSVTVAADTFDWELLQPAVERISAMAGRIRNGHR